MDIKKIGSQLMNNRLNFETSPVVDETKKLSFEKLLNKIDSIETNQIVTKENAYQSIKHGRGDAHEMIMAMQKATSQIKTASLMRDKFVESYSEIMRMQL